MWSLCVSSFSFSAACVRARDCSLFPRLFNILKCVVHAFNILWFHIHGMEERSLDEIKFDHMQCVCMLLSYAFRLLFFLSMFLNACEY